MDCIPPKGAPMPLSDPAIKKAKPGVTPAGLVTVKPYKIADGGGLYLLWLHRQAGSCGG